MSRRDRNRAELVRTAGELATFAGGTYPSNHRSPAVLAVLDDPRRESELIVAARELVIWLEPLRGEDARTVAVLDALIPYLEPDIGDLLAEGDEP